MVSHMIKARVMMTVMAISDELSRRPNGLSHAIDQVQSGLFTTHPQPLSSFQTKYQLNSRNKRFFSSFWSRGPNATDPGSSDVSINHFTIPTN